MKLPLGFTDMSTTVTALKSTPLNATHRKLGGKMVDFGGWDMPGAVFPGILDEHRAVREAVGLFDVSHMGEIEITGPEALAVCRECNHQRGLEACGADRRSTQVLLYEHGGFVDDILVHKVH